MTACADDLAQIVALTLPAADLDLAVDPAGVVITSHAVQRYRERVEGVSSRLAVRRIRSLIATARWRSRPLPWTSIVLHPGIVYGYAAGRPDVCLLMRNDAVVTVLTRAMFCDLPRQRRAAQSTTHL